MGERCWATSSTKPGTPASWSEIGESLGVSKQAAQQRQVAPDRRADDGDLRAVHRPGRFVVAGSEASRELRHNYIGTEHLLLAQFKAPEGLSAQVLVESGLTQESVRQAIVDAVGEGAEEPEGHLPFTPRSTEVFTGALAAALELGHNYIGTEHLLLGLVRTEGLAKGDPDDGRASTRRRHREGRRQARGFSRAGHTETRAAKAGNEEGGT